MQTPQEKSHRPYQNELRHIGTLLDSKGARGIGIMELADEYAVWYRGGGGNGLPEMHRFSFTALTGRPPVGGPAPASSYQDVLRAIGYELEQLPAYGLLLDELDEGLLLTYQYLNPTEGYVVRKAIVLVDREVRQDMLSRAHGRRQLPAVGRAWHRLFSKE